jgi:hypothetical protein
MMVELAWLWLRYQPGSALRVRLRMRARRSGRGAVRAA